jgi:hypothetical protein
VHGQTRSASPPIGSEIASSFFSTCHSTFLFRILYQKIITPTPMSSLVIPRSSSCRTEPGDKIFPAGHRSGLLSRSCISHGRCIASHVNYPGMLTTAYYHWSMQEAAKTKYGCIPFDYTSSTDTLSRGLFISGSQPTIFLCQPHLVFAPLYLPPVG